MKRHEFPIMPDAVDMILAGLAGTLMFYYWFGIFGIIPPALFILFTLYFFRNPQRVYAGPAEEVISPADGYILFVEEVEEPKYLDGPAIKIAVFMNVFNVHVNRTPIDAEVEYIEYKEGKFLPAFKGHASSINERNYMGLRSKYNPKLKVLVVQITGFIARRIVCWAKVGNNLARGERFGLIKFGSCVEVYLPKGSEICVKLGQKVRSGETVIGRLHNE